LRKIQASYDLGKKGSLKKSDFFLSCLRTFNLTLENNTEDICLFFKPNSFCMVLSIVRDILFYLNLHRFDKEILDEICSSKTQVKKDLELLLMILKEALIFFGYRLRYKEEHEQSKEFQNTSLIETMIFIFNCHLYKRIPDGVSSTLFHDLVYLSEINFQLISSLIGSFEFLLKLILEKAICNSVDEVLYMRILNLSLRSCFESENRRKFWKVVNTILTKTIDDMKPCPITLLNQYGCESFNNLLLQVKDKFVVDNLLQFFILRRITVRESSCSEALVEVLNTISLYGDFSILSFISKFLISRLSNEVKKDLPTKTARIQNTLELIGRLTKIPHYKSMFLYHEVLLSLGVLITNKQLRADQTTRSLCIPIFVDLFTPEQSINNALNFNQEEQAIYTDAVTKEQLSDFVKGVAHSIQFPGKDIQESDFIEGAKLVKFYLDILAAFFRANYSDSLCHRDLQVEGFSCIFKLIVSVADIVSSTKGPSEQRVRAVGGVIDGLLACILNSLLPGQFSKNTYGPSARLKYIGLMAGNDKDTSKASSLISNMIQVYTHWAQLSNNESEKLKILQIIVTSNLKKTDEALQEMKKYLPETEEKELVKKSTYYEVSFEKTYNIRFDLDKKEGDVIKELITGLDTLNRTQQIRIELGKPEAQANLSAQLDIREKPLVTAIHATSVEAKSQAVNRNPM
jgi:hypothetical protein